MSLIKITITKLNGTNCVQWATKMALPLQQNQVYGIIKEYNDKPGEPAANTTTTEMASFKDWMNRHGVARSTVLQGLQLRIQEEYMVVDNAKMLWERHASAYKLKSKLNIFKVREDLCNIQLQECGDVDKYASPIDGNVKDYALCTGLSTADTDADTDPAKSTSKMSEQEYIFNLYGRSQGMTSRKSSWRILWTQIWK